MPYSKEVNLAQLLLVAWVIYCCITNNPHTQQLQTTLIISHLSGSGTHLAGSSGSTSLKRLQARCPTSCSSHVKSPLGMGHLPTRSRGCWQVSVPCGLLARGHPKSPSLLHWATHHVAACFIKASDPRRAGKRGDGGSKHDKGHSLL